MAYSIINDVCIGCGTCEAECPVSAICFDDPRLAGQQCDLLQLGAGYSRRELLTKLK